MTTKLKSDFDVLNSIIGSRVDLTQDELISIMKEESKKNTVTLKKFYQYITYCR